MLYNEIRGTEEKYYGSPLNKFIAENCKKNMTVMNIDLITYDRDKKHIRIIESKHLNERTGYGQTILLKLLCKLVKQIAGHKVTVFIIRGNPPYDSAYLENILTGKRKKVDRDYLIRFLNYDI
tara:strand:- start:7187 stop:7555 length:369 start_codon:yes stop_codon:yes gene_type:complete